MGRSVSEGPFKERKTNTGTTKKNTKGAWVGTTLTLARELLLLANLLGAQGLAPEVHLHLCFMYVCVCVGCW